MSLFWDLLPGAASLSSLSGLYWFVWRPQQQLRADERSLAEAKRYLDRVKLEMDPMVAGSVPRPLVDLEPERPEDTSWYDVMGIPFDDWCEAGECRQFMGYTFKPGVIAELARRRDAGEFVRARQLLQQLRKPANILPKAEPPVLRKKRSEPQSDPSSWAELHGPHGIEWKRFATIKDGDQLTGVCHTCQECWRYNFGTGACTIAWLKPSPKGLYRDADMSSPEMQKMIVTIQQEQQKACLDTNEQYYDLPPNPGAKRRSA